MEDGFQRPMKVAKSSQQHLHTSMLLHCHLQEVLRVLDLLGGAVDGDDPLVRVRRWVVHVDHRPRLQLDLTNPRASLTDDRSCKLSSTQSHESQFDSI